MVGDGAGVVAEADAAIEAGRAQPQRPAIVAACIGQPEADMMPAVGAEALRLFEGEILGAAIEQQPADRRIGVGVVEQHAFTNLDRGLQGHGVGGVPAGDGEGVHYFLSRTDKTDIDGIARNALRRVRHHLEAVFAKAAIVKRPEFRCGKIGERQIGGQQGRHPDCNASPKTSLAHERRPIRAVSVACRTLEINGQQRAAGLSWAIVSSRGQQWSGSWQAASQWR